MTVSVSLELEVLAAVYSVLSVSSDLLNSGLNPNSNGSGRTVKVFNQVTQNEAVPYVRLGVTDMLPLDAETFEYSYVPSVANVHITIDVFSDYQIESHNIANVVKGLLQHREISTANFHGSTWLLSIDHIVDDTSQSDYIYYHSSIRLEARVEKTT